MARRSPILPLLEPAQPLIEQYGPSEEGVEPILIVQTLGVVETEYGAIRKHAGVLDEPQRATLIVSGADRLAFLNRMLTQELKDASPGVMRRSFWLSRKGRVDADLRVLVLADRVVLDVDAFAAERARATLSGFIIADDVSIVDASAEWHRVSVHGPRAGAVVGASVEAGRVGEATIAGAAVLIARDDTAGGCGLHVFMKVGEAPAVYRAIVGAGAKPVGWAAWNIARLEAGTPVYPLDFGHDALPAETGVLKERVSFTKGCYLGQEIVARMNALGHPKQIIVGLQVDAGAGSERVGADHAMQDAPEAARVPQPEGGARVFAAGVEVGRVSSSAVSPLLGNRAIALVSVKWGSHTPGTRVEVEADGHRAGGVLCDLGDLGYRAMGAGGGSKTG